MEIIKNIDNYTNQFSIDPQPNFSQLLPQTSIFTQFTLHQRGQLHIMSSLYSYLNSL